MYECVYIYVGTFLELLGSLFGFLYSPLVSHIEENSLPPLPYKHELKRKEYHQLLNCDILLLLLYTILYLGNPENNQYLERQLFSHLK